MSPVTLRDPDGSVIAYACGVCWRVPEHSVPMFQDYKKPDRRELRRRCSEADTCCRCNARGCRRQVVPNGSECERHTAQRQAVESARRQVQQEDGWTAFSRELPIAAYVPSSSTIPAE